MFIHTVLSAALLGAHPIATDTADADTIGFRHLEGVYVQDEAPVTHRSQGGIAGDCARHVAGLMNPGAIVRDGDTLYVGNNQGQNTNVVTVIDISLPGEEQIVDNLSTPINPVDIEVVGNDLYVISQDRDELHWRPIAGGEWQFIPLPNAQITEWEYGNIMYHHEGFMYVLHFAENKISVVDLAAKKVVHTIDDLSFLPNRIVFADDTMIVLSVGLAAPSCSASGPHFSVYDLNTLTRIFEQDISGDCPLTCGVVDGDLYVVFNNSLRAYDLNDGSLLDTLHSPTFSRHISSDGTNIYIQRPNGTIERTTTALKGFDLSCNVLIGSQVWFPPIEQMTLAGDDARLFITNRNDNTVAILDLDIEVVPGDLNGDGVVDVFDLLILLGNWGDCTDPDDCPADLNGDGVVDVFDLLILLGNWG